MTTRHTPGPWKVIEAHYLTYEAAYQRGYLDGMAKPCIECADRQWVGLTQDEFREFATTYEYGTGGLIRAIEAKLKEKNT